VKTYADFYDALPEDERIIVDVLHQIVRSHLPKFYKEKLSWGVPYFYGNRGICLIFPASVRMSGVDKGVLLGFSHGKDLEDVDGYLTNGTNKQVFYKIYTSVNEIDEEAIKKLLTEAMMLDERKQKTGRKF